jgi:hypothetical protein
VGTPNPYGTNPNGIASAADQAAPLADSTAASSMAVAPSSAATDAVAPPAAARDTGRRGVSNLPAWMTKGQTS